MDLGSTNLSTFTLPAPTDAPAPAPTDPLALKPGETPKAPSTNFYSLMNQADVQNPFGAQAGGAGGSMSSGLFARETAPQNTKGVNETLNPSEDLAGNTKLFLAGNGYNSGDYNVDYNAALDAASDAVMAKMPAFPLSTGNFARTKRRVTPIVTKSTRFEGKLWLLVTHSRRISMRVTSSVLMLH